MVASDDVPKGESSPFDTEHTLTVEQLRNRLALHDGALPVHLLVFGVSKGLRDVQVDTVSMRSTLLKRLVLRSNRLNSEERVERNRARIRWLKEHPAVWANWQGDADIRFRSLIEVLKDKGFLSPKTYWRDVKLTEMIRRADAQLQMGINE